MPEEGGPSYDGAADRRLRLLLEAGAVLSAGRDLADGLGRLAPLLAQELGDYVLTYLLEDETHVRRVGLGHRPSVPAAAARTFLSLPMPTLDTPGAGQAMRTGVPIFAPDIRSELLEETAQSKEHLDLLRSLAPTSAIVVPLRGPNGAFGAISLTTTATGQPRFTQDDLAFVTEVARRVSLMADNVRLFDEARRELEARRAAESELRKRYEQLRVLYQMTEAVSRAGALDVVFDAAVDALIAALGADRASILLYDPDGVLRFKAWQGLSEGYRAAVEGHSPWTPDTVDPAPILTPDVLEAQDLDAELRATIAQEGIRSLAFIPLAFGPGLLGKFMVYFDRPHTPPPEDMALALAVARNVAFAIARVRDEEQLRAARDAALQANVVKSQFLAVMSHELRTPLNAIMGYADLLDAEVGGSLTAAQASQVERVRSSARLLLELIEEVLIYARLEAGREDVRAAEVDLRSLAREAADMVEPICLAKGVRFELHAPEGAVVLTTDPGKVRQIILNLLSNAAKFTDAGTVALDVAARGSWVEVSVRDSGPGVRPEDAERIFEPFVQADATATREKGGTGLGLAVCRRLARLLGGDVTLAETAGPGSEFVLRLPVAILPF